MLSTWVLSGVVFGVDDRLDDDDDPLLCTLAVDALLVDEDAGELLAVVLVNPFVVDLDGNRFEDLN